MLSSSPGGPIYSEGHQTGCAFPSFFLAPGVTTPPNADGEYAVVLSDSSMQISARFGDFFGPAVATLRSPSGGIAHPQDQVVVDFSPAPKVNTFRGVDEPIGHGSFWYLFGTKITDRPALHRQRPGRAMVSVYRDDLLSGKKWQAGKPSDRQLHSIQSDRGRQLRAKSNRREGRTSHLASKTGQLNGPKESGRFLLRNHLSILLPSFLVRGRAERCLPGVLLEALAAGK